MTPPCLFSAWSACQHELLGFLRHRLSHPEDAEDLLQEVFIKAMCLSSRFCDIENPRAWLFHVARNALADKLRLAREQIMLPDDLAAPEPNILPAVDDLTQCLPRVLSELPEADRLAIQICDIEGKSQQFLAEQLGISLSGAKSRIQRARLRLKQRMESACQVRYDEQGKVDGFTPRPLPAETAPGKTPPAP